MEEKIKEILSAYGAEDARRLNRKADAAVYDCGDFVLRIYQRDVAAYAMLAGKELPGVPRVYEYGCWQGRPSGAGQEQDQEPGQVLYVAKEERIDGICLQEMIDGGERFSPQRAVETVRQVCEALQTLHSIGIVHRDVKPEHIMMSADGKIYLIDLDAAVRLAPEKENNRDTVLLGTAVYAAPEQFGLTRSDARTDIFALGITLNIMLTGKHPAVEQYAGKDLAPIIAKCTEMNPQRRYQNVGELMEDLRNVVFLEYRKKKSRRIKAGLAVVCACVLALIGYFVYGWLTPEISESSELTDTSYIVCSKSSGNTYTPFETRYIEDQSMLSPPQVYLSEGHTFYVLSLEEAETLTLPELDCYREKTGKNVNAETKMMGTIERGDKEYFIWRIDVPEDFEGAVRCGLAFDGKMAEYNLSGDSENDHLKFIWLLDESYAEESFVTEFDDTIIPCTEDPSGQSFVTVSRLATSDLVLESALGESLGKSINMSLEPGDDENAFYIVHPEGTSIACRTQRVFAYGLDSSGYGEEFNGGRFVQTLQDEIFDYEDVGTVSIGDEERIVTRVSLSEYLGHEEINATFRLVDANGKKSTEWEGAACVKLKMGINVVVEGAEMAANAGIDDDARILEGIVGLKQETETLDFVETEDGTFAAFLPRACSIVSDEGEGRLVTIAAQPQDGWEIADIVDASGKQLAFVEEDTDCYALLGDDGEPIYDGEAIFASGWQYGMSGTSGWTKDGVEEDRQIMDVFSCVRERICEYADWTRHTELGNGNKVDFEEFIKEVGEETVRLEGTIKKFTIYFDEADDASVNEIRFVMEKDS